MDQHGVDIDLHVDDTDGVGHDRLPSNGYIGPTGIKVYWDSLYNSFAFGYDA